MKLEITAIVAQFESFVYLTDRREIGSSAWEISTRCGDKRGQKQCKLTVRTTIAARPTAQEDSPQKYKGRKGTKEAYSFILCAF
jgi:hypothetical protein